MVTSYTAVHFAFWFVYIYYIVRLALWSPVKRLSTCFLFCLHLLYCTFSIMITLYTADQFALCFVYIYYIERLALWSPFIRLSTLLSLLFTFIILYV